MIIEGVGTTGRLEGCIIARCKLNGVSIYAGAEPPLKACKCVGGGRAQAHAVGAASLYIFFIRFAVGARAVRTGETGRGP